MYRAFVRHRLRKTFLGELSRGDYEAIVRRTAPGVVQSFPGEGALGGTRESREALRAWFERLFRLVPVLRFSVDEIVVTGWPWRTLAAVTWRNQGEAADGEPYVNSGCEVFEIRWGRATRLVQYLDTQAVHESLERMAAAGIEEAAAPPLVASPAAPVAAARPSG
jgi:ketosteroid isomerase-like protein